MDIQVIKSKRKTIGLEVHTDGRVILRAPTRITNRELNKFIDNHMSWIESKLSLIEKKNADKIIVAPPKETISQKELDAIKEKFTTRVQYYCNIMGVSVNRISIKDQKTRWGSCSSKGNVNFNYNLYYMPEELLDYVVVHELSHRKYMNHSQSFWCEVEKYCPEYKLCRRRLKDYTLSI